MEEGEKSAVSGDTGKCRNLGDSSFWPQERDKDKIQALRGKAVESESLTSYLDFLMVFSFVLALF